MNLCGKWIALDGIDGCGKSTQLGLLRNHLEHQGYQVVVAREPGETRLGERIREILLHSTDVPITPLAETLLFAASRAQMYYEVVTPVRQSQKVLLTDRSYLSTVAYQGIGLGVSERLIDFINSIALSAVLPDIVIVIDIAENTMMTRIGSQKDRIERRGWEYLRRVRQAFADIIGPGKVLINGNDDIYAVHKAIVEAIDSFHAVPISL